MARQDLRDRYVSLLMEEVSGCEYPSVSMMDRLEQAIRDPESARRYLDALMDHIERDQYPSPPLLDRLAQLIEGFERSAIRE